jgi:hypothetical protein
MLDARFRIGLGRHEMARLNLCFCTFSSAQGSRSLLAYLSRRHFEEFFLSLKN